MDDNPLALTLKALHHWVERGDIVAINTLLDRNPEIGIDATYEHGWTPLIVAAFHGRLDLVQYLLERGAEVNVQASFGWTALMFAADHGHYEIVKTLLEAGANATLLVEGDDNAYDFAIDSGNTQIGELLKAYGGYDEEESKARRARKWRKMMEAQGLLKSDSAEEPDAQK